MEKKLDPNLKIGRDLEILEKLVRNWPISKNSRNSGNFEDIGVCFFTNIFFLIVELNCKIKIGDKMQTEENIFFLRGAPGALPPGKIGLDYTDLFCHKRNVFSIFILSRTYFVLLL